MIRWKQSFLSAGCGGTGLVILYFLSNRREGEHLEYWEGWSIRKGAEHCYSLFISCPFTVAFLLFSFTLFVFHNNIIIPMRKDRGVVIRWKQGCLLLAVGGHSLPPFPLLTPPNASPSKEHWEGRSIGKGGSIPFSMLQCSPRLNAPPSQCPSLPMLLLPSNASPSQEHWEGRSIGEGEHWGMYSTTSVKKVMLLAILKPHCLILTVKRLANTE